MCKKHEEMNFKKFFNENTIENEKQKGRSKKWKIFLYRKHRKDKMHKITEKIKKLKICFTHKTHKGKEKIKIQERKIYELLIQKHIKRQEN